MADKQTYLKHVTDHEAEAPPSTPAWLRDLRRSAARRFDDIGFPTTKNEAWRFTRVRPLLRHDFTLSTEYRRNGLATEHLDNISFMDAGCRRLVFVNGHFAEELSAPGDLPERAKLTGLRKSLSTDADIVKEHLAGRVDTEQNPFAALNTAYLLDGAFVYVPDNTVIEEPIHLLFVTTGGDGAAISHPRNLFVVGCGGRATIVESYVSVTDGVYFTNAVTEIVAGDNAHIDHYKIQKENGVAYHMASLVAYLGRDSRFATNYVAMGGELVRNNITTHLDGEGIECTLNGLYTAGGRQHVSNYTTIEHMQPHCNSHELYKGILSERAHGVFNGKIHVHPDAQKTDAKQSNGAMLLSDTAQINTNPQLEIYADDVKCTHGAVIGQIDENAVFYLRSRGIGRAEARCMLIFAFANEVIERVKVEPLRDRLTRDLFAWLSRNQH